MQNPTNLTTDATERAERAPYEPPAILEDLPLEVYSLACGKADISCGDNTIPPQTS